MINANERMLQILYGLRVGSSKPLSSRLASVIGAGIVEEEGCYFLAACRAVTKGDIAAFGDRTGLECFVNKVYIEEKQSSELQEQGLLFAEALRTLLASRGSFNIIVSISYSDLDTQSDSLTCTVRFHKMRARESWLKDNLNSYVDEALLVISTAVVPPEAMGTA